MNHKNRKFPCNKNIKKDNTINYDKITFSDLKKRAQDDDIRNGKNTDVCGCFDAGQHTLNAQENSQNVVLMLKNDPKNFLDIQAANSDSKVIGCQNEISTQDINKTNICNQEIIHKKIKKIHKCKNCGYIFTRKYNLKLHIEKNRCKILHNIDLLNKTEINQDKQLDNNSIIKNLENRIKELENKILDPVSSFESLSSERGSRMLSEKPCNININNISDNSVNSHNTHNTNYIKTQNNIILNFKNEDLSYITSDDKIKILNVGYDSLLELVKHVHCNKEHPENNNIYVSNLKSKYCQVMIDGEMKTMFLPELLTDVVDVRINNLEEISNNIKLHERKKINGRKLMAVGKLIDIVNGKEEPLYSKKKEEIMMALYDNTKNSK
jgi:hypothetical protein